MKKYIAEIIGTFFLVVFGCKVAVTTGNLLTIAIAFGLVIVAMAYSVGNISGCHINPARSIGPALLQAFAGNTDALAQIWIFIVGPFVGAALAAIVYKALTKQKAE